MKTNTGSVFPWNPEIRKLTGFNAQNKQMKNLFLTVYTSSNLHMTTMLRKSAVMGSNLKRQGKLSRVSRQSKTTNFKYHDINGG